MNIIQEVEVDIMWISRSMAKQDRWSSGEWTPESEFEKARGLLPILPFYVIREDNTWFVMWIKCQFILTEEQVEKLVAEKAAVVAAQKC